MSSSGRGTVPLDHNQGNVVCSAACGKKVSELYCTKNLPERFDNPSNCQGYGKPKGCENPMYMTSSSNYGLIPPNLHTAPVCYHGKQQKFSQHLGQAGMSRAMGLNTAMDHSKVHKSLDP
eukprot:gene8228-10154_t